MKSSIIIVCVCVALFPLGVFGEIEWTDELRARESEQVSLWRSKLKDTAGKPGSKRLEALSLGLRNMGYRRQVEGHSTDVVAVYFELQTALLSIPGHAEYYRDEIERERAKVEPGGYQGSYDQYRHWWFETLSCLPSPETIWVLGEYLGDERDAAKEAKRAGGMLPGGVPNSRYSVDTIGIIGLRHPAEEPPEKEEFRLRSDRTYEENMRAAFDYHEKRRAERLKPWDAWWAEVKAGERAFSFKGQDVEYRFKPDGTWEETKMESPPDDGPKGTLPEKTTPIAEPEPVVEEEGFPWVWTVLGAVLIFGLGVLFFAKRRADGCGVSR
ncbi:MAG: hypothetical protein ACQCXQ_16170 [Verrucomicrobiales bacterium]|nr:hypothetical protein [Verrucomicrobiota bacterium JB025]